MVWGNDSYIYNGLKKRSPITYFYQSLFKYNTELSKEAITDFTNQIREKKPTLIIDANKNGMIALNQSNLSDDNRGQVETLKDFLAIIQSDYEFVEDRNGLTYYKLKKNE